MTRPRCAAGLLLIATGLSWNVDLGSHEQVTTTVRFTREVASLLNARCAPCHGADRMAMPLQTYEDVRPWAVAIKEQVLGGHMPPWPADRGIGLFANDGGLTRREREFLLSWIDGGTPRGDGEPPPFIDHGGHWMLGRPDAVYTASQGQRSPRPGFTRFIVAPRLDRAVWVRALDLKPHDRFARAAFVSVEGTGTHLGGWTPWATGHPLPPDTALRLAPGTRLVIDVLGASGDRDATARPELALYTTTTGPGRVATDAMMTARAGATGPLLLAEHRLTRETRLGSLAIELSEAGRSVEVRARRPDASIEPLLLVPRFTRDWQTPYVFRTPLVFPSGTVIEAIGHFDEHVPGAHQLVVHAQIFTAPHQP